MRIRITWENTQLNILKDPLEKKSGWDCRSLLEVASFWGGPKILELTLRTLTYFCLSHNPCSNPTLSFLAQLQSSLCGTLSFAWNTFFQVPALRVHALEVTRWGECFIMQAWCWFLTGLQVDAWNLNGTLPFFENVSQIELTGSSVHCLGLWFNFFIL